MYQNLYGNKRLDLNAKFSPFSNFNSVFASTGKSDLGSVLLEKTRQLSEVSKRYRLCIISQIEGGERTLSEVKFDI